MVARDGESTFGSPESQGWVTAQALEEALVRRTFWFLAVCSVLILVPVKLAWLLQGGRVVGLLGILELVTVLWCAWRVWTSQTGAARFLGVGLAIMYLQVGAVAWMQGGLQAPALRWLAVLPIIAIVAGNLRLGLGFCVAFAAQILVMAFYEPPYLATLRPMVLPNAHAQTLVSTVGSVVLFSAFGWIAVRWRSQVHQVLEASHQQARRGSEAKQRFLAIMSHEIRTPLNGIVGTASLLRQKNMAPSEQRQMLHLLDHSAQTLRSLLDDVLDWAKLEAGQLDVRQEPMRLRDLVVDSAELFAVTAFDKGLELTYSFEVGVPPLLLGDEMRLRQTLNNLVSNAVKFTRQGGVHVHLATEPSPNPQDARVWVRIEVQDTGIGMSSAQLANLFQPFSQADQSTTRQYGGTGLGLSIGRELTRCMGGDIVVSSRMGVGSCFVIRVPMGVAEAITHEPAEAAPLAGKRLRLVTSSLGLRRQVQSLCQELGLVLAPEDASDAEVDAVLVDAAVEVPGAPSVAAWSWGAPAQPKALVSSAMDKAPAQVPAEVLHLYKPLRGHALADWLNGTLAATAEPPPSTRPTAALKVLVAEDSELNRALLSEMLSHCRAKTELVGTGLAAVNAVKAQHFDLLLMDYQMPEMDGLAATRAIRQHEAEQGGPALPIVLISGEVSVDSHAVWRAAGVNHILCKPYAFDELARVLATITPVEAS
ncbi:MAG: hypothetical protein C0487_05990 [Leptothrix sp. (in: Bacteria)]|nr:hypothetical protein [Leptothrix sp. (in: b-proteobacteria)]